MKKLLLLVVFSMSSYGDFINLSEVRSQQGSGAACELATLKFDEVTNNFEKTYYKKKISGCDRQKSYFKLLNREEKKKVIREEQDAAMVYLKKALDNKEYVVHELLERIAVEAGNYPAINEGLVKLKIEHVRNAKQDVPDETQGDVHEIGPYIFEKYNDMANAYIMNGMFEDADRIISEFGQTIAGQSGQARLKETTESFRLIFEKKQKNKRKGIKSKSDPKKVTAQLRKASAELAQNKRSDLIVNNESSAELREELVVTESIILDSIIEKYGLYFLALVLFLVLGVYLYSRHKRMKAS